MLLGIFRRSAHIGFWLSFAIYAAWALPNLLRDGSTWWFANGFSWRAVSIFALLWPAFTFAYFGYFGGLRILIGLPRNGSNSN